MIKKSIFLVVLIVFVAATVFADGAEVAYRVLKDGKWGAISPDGSVILEPEYDWVFPFVNGISVVRKGGYTDGKRAYVRADGSFLTGFDYDFAYNFFGTLAVVSQDGKEGYINKNGSRVTRIRYDYAEDFRGEYALVRMGSWSDGKWGIVNSQGHQTTQPSFTKLRHGPGEYSFVGEIEGQYFLVDPDGNRLTEDSYNNLYASGDYYIGVENNALPSRFSILAEDGRALYRTSDGMTQIRFITGKLAAVNTSGKYGLISVTGQDIIDPKYDGIWIASDNVVITGIGKGRSRQYGLSSTNGSEIFPPSYSWISGFSEDGMALVMEDGMYGCINEAGQIVARPKFSSIRQFSEGLAAVEQDGLWGFIDTRGQLVIDYAFEWVYDFSEGMALIREGDWDGGKRGYIDTNGVVIIEPRFDWAYSFENGIAHVAFGSHYGGTFGYIDTTGSYVWEPSN